MTSPSHGGRVVLKMDRDLEQLPHLISLLDDPSETVQASVADALRAFGDSLNEALDSLAEPPDDAQRMAIRRLIAEDDAPAFAVGQLVRHKRYAYRGVVVDIDGTCQASDEWYQRNQTQPGRDQPWYHVLVDGSDQSSYPAQTSLEADVSAEEVCNPYVSEFFSDFLDGRYIRNDRPWPKG